MTLLEMANYVCTKTRRTDAGAVTRAKEFLARRYEMIAADELWKDLVYRLEFTFDVTETAAANLFGPNFQSRDVGIWHLPAVVDKVLAVRSASSSLEIDDPFQMMRSTMDEFADTGDPIKFYVEGAVVADLRGKLADVTASGVAISGADADAATPIRVRYLDLSGEMQTLNGVLDAGGSSDPFQPSVIVSASKTETTAALTLYMSGTGAALSVSQAAATQWSRLGRLRVVPIPTGDVALKALVKLKVQAMTDDNDEPQINGIENCLIAFAQADALQHARQYGKAQIVTQEAMALMLQLKRVAVAQEASLQRIVPAVGDVAGEWDAGISAKGSW
jgi:hypothetical protein